MARTGRGAVLALEKVRIATESWQRLGRERWEAIVAAKATHGATGAALARAAGVSRDRIYQMFDKRRVARGRRNGTG